MSNEPTNPYAPTVYVDNDESWELTGQTLDAKNIRLISVGRTVVTWEKLRLLYNLILACVTVLACGFFMVSAICPIDVKRLIGTIFVGMFFANVCFCFGPFIDGYLSWAGWRSTLTTSIIFLVGTLISIPLAVLAVVGSVMTDF